MEFLDPQAKKKKKQRLYVGYVLVAILIGLATYILLATAVGYELLPSKGVVVQNGLLFVDATPGSSTVTINGKPEENKTEAKFALVGGAYDIGISQPGYVDWSKRINLEGGQVKFVNYPKLFPLVISPESISDYSASVGFSTQSPDRKWLLVQPNAEVPSINIYDLESEELKSTSFVIPQTTLSPKDGSYGVLSPIEWSTDNKHLLISQTLLDGKKNFFVIDRESGDATINLNTLFSSNPTSVTLFDKKPGKFYFYFADAGTLRIAESNTRIVSEPIIEQVLAYKSYGNDLISFVTPKDAESGKVFVKIRDNDKIYALSQIDFDPASKYLLDIVKFRNNWFYPVGSSASDRVIIYRNPLDAITKKVPEKPVVAAILRLNSPQAIEFSANTRFLLIQSGSKFNVYDAEAKENYVFEITDKIDQGTTAKWMDGHRIQYTSGGKLLVTEFDGKNTRNLVQNKPSTTGFFSNNYEELYTIGLKADGSSVLQRSSLIIKK